MQLPDGFVYSGDGTARTCVVGLRGQVGRRGLRGARSLSTSRMIRRLLRLDVEQTQRRSARSEQVTQLEIQQEVIKSRGDRIRTYDPLVPNQMR